MSKTIISTYQGTQNSLLAVANFTKDFVVLINVTCIIAGLIPCV
jgi:hypothetical protein